MHIIARRRFPAIALAAALAALFATSVGASAGASGHGGAAEAAVSPATTPAWSQAPYCGITWGSLGKTAFVGAMGSGNILRTRTGMHACYDRLVFDIAPGSGQLGYNVGYRDRLTVNGLPVPVNGGALIGIAVWADVPLSTSTTNFPGWRTFRQLKHIGNFMDGPASYTVYGLGVRARLPMRVFVLTNADGGRRLVVDVAHRW